MVRTNIFYGLFHSFVCFLWYLTTFEKFCGTGSCGIWGSATQHDRSQVHCHSPRDVSLESEPCGDVPSKSDVFLLFGEATHPIQKSTRTLPRNSSKVVLLSDCYDCCCFFCFEMGFSSTLRVEEVGEMVRLAVPSVRCSNQLNEGGGDRTIDR